jgi:hypothetical protein
VGVPGTLSVLETAHKEHGKLPWATLMQPAIQLAEQGFKISPRLHQALLAENDLINDAVAASYFYDAQRKPHPVGYVLKNPELAAVLRDIANRGSLALKQGAVAQALVQKVRQHPTKPGSMTLQDLAQYKVIKREPLCFDHVVQTTSKGFQICGFPPPSSGALAIGQQNHRLNDLPPKARFLGHDIFKTWGKINKMGPYGVIVIDPPSYQKGSFIATKDYIKLIRRLPDLLEPQGHVLLCLNAPELDTQFLHAQVAEAAPSLRFVERLANPAAFVDIDPEKSLKVLHYQNA